ncbi:MAG: ATP-dependent RNA helicase HrpA [Ilumatobacteraceae bacterium]|nr:ATP-dependent RNA helicase HrpA [Ilumatobacteraceae bacterium]
MGNDTRPRAAAAAALIASGRLAPPAELPIFQHRNEIVEAIRDHQVVVIAGETGSGKSTQLPKLCVEAGRGVDGLIGHTQPRRVAARAVAERVASEVGVKLGTAVGYSVRFADEVRDDTVVRVMTDGILLTDIQRDPRLERYDTIIVDEAHERSLNIDVILGYLARLMPARPDLRVIITSATIDTARFAQHFTRDGQPPVPVIAVSGRSYPVEVRYRPLVELDADGGVVERRDQVEGVLAALDEVERNGPGDVLVFLSGEREIHDIADALRRSGGRPDVEVLPLYARLSAAEQHRIFDRSASSARRVVLATNIAETSLTVPGIRFVVDTGTARISRYSRRLKVQRLPIEPVSQASANQRAGRCGRLGPGICLRLYSQDDFVERPEFTEPEILRTSLAAVILQMSSIGIDDLEGFPFLEPPDSASIRDGYRLLEELGALRGEGRGLTRIGRRLARLPIDPRLGRMILEADRHNCVREVLVIAAGLSIQDPRERPDDRREQAAEQHNRFRTPGSDLLSMVALWDYLREIQRELSGNAFRRRCRAEYLHYVRVREWMDLFSQLRRVAGSLGIRPGPDEGHPDRVHRAVLAGLLSHVGMRGGERREFIGARQSRFIIAPGSVLTRRPPPWVMAAELVETNQLYARRVAAIDPSWIEPAAKHLTKRSYGEARWDERGGRAVTTERVTLYGLPIVTDRVVGLDRLDRAAARAWFISRALVAGETDVAWYERQQFLQHNRHYLDAMQRRADRARRSSLVDDEALYEFYAGRVGEDVVSTRSFDKWWKDARSDEPDLLDLSDAALRAAMGSREPLPTIDEFPDVWRHEVSDTHSIELPLTYRYAPDEALDGVTVHVPVSALNQLRSPHFDWQVPGHRRALVEVLVRSLPKAVRRDLIPLGETIDEVVNSLGQPSGELRALVAQHLSTHAGLTISPDAFDVAMIPEHLRMHIVVSDDEGTVVAVGDDLDTLRDELRDEVRQSIAAAAPIAERRGIVTWDVGDLPRIVESSDRALDVVGYPTLLDVGDSVALRVVSTPDLQERAMRGGVRRLLLLNGAPAPLAVARAASNDVRLTIARGDIALDDVAADCVVAAVDQLIDEHGSLPWSETEFATLRRLVRDRADVLADRALVGASDVIAASVAVHEQLARLHAASVRDSIDDANAHLGRLVRPGFVASTGIDRLADVERYVRAISYRLDHLAGAVERDRRRMATVHAIEAQFDTLVSRARAGALSREVSAVRWELEELRVATFAEPLVVRGRSTSPARVSERIAAL